MVKNSKQMKLIHSKVKSMNFLNTKWAWKARAIRSCYEKR